MSATQLLELPITLSLSGLPDSTGTIKCMRWHKSARIKRAVLAAVSIIALSLILLFIPVVHLFVIPLFLFGLPITTIWFYLQSERRTGGTGTCPKCHKSLQILAGRSEATFFQICTECQAYLRITVLDQQN